MSIKIFTQVKPKIIVQTYSAFHDHLRVVDTDGFYGRFGKKYENGNDWRVKAYNGFFALNLRTKNSMFFLRNFFFTPVLNCFSDISKSSRKFGSSSKILQSLHNYSINLENPFETGLGSNFFNFSKSNFNSSARF